VFANLMVQALKVIRRDIGELVDHDQSPHTLKFRQAPNSFVLLA
jgi:hypothetical protein